MNNLELEITSKAYNDMEIISEFIAKDNKTTANIMMELFYKTFKMLLKHPNIGNSRPDFTYLVSRVDFSQPKCSGRLKSTLLAIFGLIITL